MTLLPDPAHMAWAWGTPAQRSNGGLPALLWWDTVLGYSTPAVPPPFWPVTDPGPPVVFAPGQYQGYERNFSRPEGVGSPNFPSESPFMMVLPAMLGLKDSETAPRRLFDGGEGDNTNQPFTQSFSASPATGGALRWIDFYASTFAASTTLLMVMIPERELINLLGDSEDPDNIYDVDPIKASGEAAIKRYIETMLANHGSRIFAWYLIDEPDLKSHGRRNFADPKSLSQAYDFIRQTEFDWRNTGTNDPAFKALDTDDLRWKALRSIVITLSSEFKIIAGDPETRRIDEDFEPEDYVITHRCADIIGYNRYPSLRFYRDIEQDYSNCAFQRFFDNELDQLTDPVLTMKVFREVRRRVNGDTSDSFKFPGDEGYIPVFLWQQADGWPFHPSAATPDPSLAPAALDLPYLQPPSPGPNTPECLSQRVTYRRRKRLPTADELRETLWMSLFELGEGLACFSQFNIADDEIVARFEPVAREFIAFQRLRTIASKPGTPARPENLNWAFSRQWTLSSQIACDPRENLAPAVLLFSHPRPADITVLASNRTLWLLILNRSPLKLILTPTAIALPQAENADLEEWRFLRSVRITDPNPANAGKTIPLRIPLNSAGGTGPISIPGHGMRLFRLIPRGLPDPNPDPV